MKYLPFASTLFLLCLVGLSAQDSNDQFANPEPDTHADLTQKVSLDAFTGQSIRFFENLSVEGYVVAGYKEGSSELLSTPVNALDFNFGSDIRLDRTARAYASFAMQYPKPQSTPSDLYNPYQPPVTISTPVDFDFNQIQVEELFLDYSLGDLAIIRLGRQSATWGQGRLFNPGNLVQGIAGGMAVKVSTALGPVAFTAVGIKNDGLYRVDTANTLVALGIASVAAAGLADYSTDWFSSGVSGFYHVNVGGKGDAYFKTSFWGADLFVEGLGEAGIDGATSFSGVAGIYREFGDKSKWLKLQLEGLLSGRGNDGTFSTVVHHGNDFTDWTLGVAATTDALSFLSTRPSVLWLHSFADNSGQAVLGFVNSALPHLDLTFGLARVYGGSDSRYVTNNPDSVQKRTLLFTVKATFNFDIKG